MYPPLSWLIFAGWQVLEHVQKILATDTQNVMALSWSALYSMVRDGNNKAAAKSLQVGEEIREGGGGQIRTWVETAGIQAQGWTLRISLIFLGSLALALGAL
jgi:hypothetical protein